MWKKSKEQKYFNFRYPMLMFFLALLLLLMGSYFPSEYKKPISTVVLIGFIILTISFFLDIIRNQ